MTADVRSDAAVAARMHEECVRVASDRALAFVADTRQLLAHGVGGVEPLSTLYMRIVPDAELEHARITEVVRDPTVFHTGCAIPCGVYTSPAFGAAFNGLFRGSGAVTRVTIGMAHSVAVEALAVVPERCGATLEHLDLRVDGTAWKFDSLVNYADEVFLTRYTAVLTGWLPICTNLQTLRLAQTYDAMRFVSLCAALERCSGLTALSLGHVYGDGTTVRALCDALDQMPRMRSVQLSSISVHQGDDNTRLLKCVANMPALVHLELPELRGWAGVAAGLAFVLKKSTQLEELRVVMNPHVVAPDTAVRFPQIARALSGNVHLRVLRISGLSRARDALDELLHAVARNTTLTSLDVRNNGGFSGDTNGLMTLIAINAALQTLTIDDNRLGETDATQAAHASRIGVALSQNTTMCSLSMMRCVDGAAATVPVIRALSTNSVLKALSVAPRYAASLSDDVSAALHDALIFKPLRARYICSVQSTGAWYPRSEHTYYYQPHMHFIVRTRIMCQAGRARAAGSDGSIIAWLCERAPLWVVVHVCALMRTNITKM